MITQTVYDKLGAAPAFARVASYFDGTCERVEALGLSEEQRVAFLEAEISSLTASRRAKQWHPPSCTYAIFLKKVFGNFRRVTKSCLRFEQMRPLLWPSSRKNALTCVTRNVTTLANACSRWGLAIVSCSTM
jgi:uncharacterized small protein (DUF1192 family)